MKFPVVTDKIPDPLLGLKKKKKTEKHFSTIILKLFNNAEDIRKLKR